MVGAETWTFCEFGLLVTGKGEKDFLPQLLRALEKSGRCTFKVIGRIMQLSPRTSKKKLILRIPGTVKPIPDKDFDRICKPAREHLNKEHGARRTFVLLIDDLEHDRASQAKAVFERYRETLDGALRGREHRASVHFLVNMLEAYYFANASAINAVLDTELTDHEGDVEEIRHPKNALKDIAASIKRSFGEIEDGEKIISLLDVEHVLSNAETCASLRTLFAWCTKAMGEEPTERFRLDSGIYSAITGPQIGTLPDSPEPP